MRARNGPGTRRPGKAKPTTERTASLEHATSGVQVVTALLADALTFGSRRKWETIATLPGGWDLAHAIRLGIKPFAELGANSETLSGSQIDSPCSC